MVVGSDEKLWPEPSAVSENTCTVPLSLEQAIRGAVGLKQML
jgi:hypothetical protein